MGRVGFAWAGWVMMVPQFSYGLCPPSDAPPNCTTNCPCDVVPPSASSNPVTPASGRFYFAQTDLDLPGYAGVNLTRNYSSTSASFSMFGWGWRCNLVNNLGNRSRVVFV